MSSSRKILDQHCTICDRERRQSLRSISTSSLDLGGTTAAKLNTLLNNKYRDLPVIKGDEFYTQVTEPQWLRRGNLKESDSVCKRHLAVLMKGVDRGSEGGCCSPLHRGARICKGTSMKSMPPAWKKRFSEHLKIKDEDKEGRMLFCWDCYKKHMDRMSKYGDPLGTLNSGIHRSHSVAESDGTSSSSSSTFRAIKRHKSMDKLTFGQYAYNSLNRRRTSAKSNDERSSDSEFRSSPVKRSSRGRRSNRGRRSPSPPDNMSPVRTSVVYSKRKHSPFKSVKPPTAWRGDTSRDPPVPPPGLFSPRQNTDKDASDIVSEADSKSTSKDANSDDFDLDSLPPPPPEMTQSFEPIPATPSPDNTYLNGFHYDVNNEQDVLTESVVMQHLLAPRQNEESTTTSAADEMAAIFANQTIDDDYPHLSGVDDNNNSKSDGQAIMIPQFIDSSDDISDLSTIPHSHYHQHQNSSESSVKTADTQIELDDFDGTEFSDDATTCQSDVIKPGDEHDLIPNDRRSEAEECDEIAPEITTADFSGSVFAAPKSLTKRQPSFNGQSVSYHLFPQSPSRLESIKLDFSENPDLPLDESVQQPTKHYFDSDARDRTHPLRHEVYLKFPRDVGANDSFVKVPAENIEIFPDAMSFLDGITQTIGEDTSMYQHDGPRIAGVDLMTSQNREAHRASQFSSRSLIVRRGQQFEISLTLSEELDDSHHIMLELTFATSESPRVSNGTHIFVPIQRNGTSSGKYGKIPGGQWLAHSLHSDDTKILKVAVTSPFTAAVGTYRINFQVEKQGLRTRWQSSNDNDRCILLLFNPWNIDDAVFMSSQSDRTEYVLSDCGCICSGNSSNPITLPWVYGQYEPGVLTGCLKMLNRCNITMTKMGDPASVAKALVTTLSRHTGGSWSDENQSASTIFSRYLETDVLKLPTGNKSLTGLIVSMFRCIGLPSRSTTCFNYASRTDVPMVVNAHLSEDGQSLDHLNTDKLWPSFSWCGVWMSRVDLPPGFGGWQAVLPPTNGCDTYGPIPSYAIKKGQISSCEGTENHFAALNAEKKTWLVARDGNMRVVGVEPKSVGTSIVCKSVGNSELQDVTKLYKFPHGSEEHKLAYHAAYLHYGSQGFYEEIPPTKRLTMTLSTNPPVINLGTEMEVITSLTSSLSAASHVTVNIESVMLSEDGSPLAKLNRETILAEVLPNEIVDIPVKINLAPFIHKLSHDAHIQLTAFGTIRENVETQNLIATHLVGVGYPSAEIQLHGEFKVGGEVTVLTKLRNPYPYKLREAKVSYNSSGLLPLDVLPEPRVSVGPWQVFRSETMFRCQRPGKHAVRVSVSSDLLRNITGIQQIDIT